MTKRTEARKASQRKYALKNKEKIRERLNEYRKTEEGRKKLALSMQKYQQLNPKGKAKNILSKMKSNSKKRGHDWSDDWWSYEQIQDMLENGRCCATGIKFELRLNDSEDKAKRNPFAISPDRIDLTKGYEPSNVQWVVWIYNLMKNTFNDEDVAKFIKALKEKHK